MNFTLVDVEAPAPLVGRVAHYQQQTGYSCAATCLSMVTGLPEARCRSLAQTTRQGTSMDNLVPALRAAGFTGHHVRVTGPLDSWIPALRIQSMTWPLILSLTFNQIGQDSKGRRRKHARHHAVVLAGGQFLDPGEFQPLDPEALGHLHQAGIALNSYILIE